MCEILKVFYVFFTLIVFLSRIIWSLSCFILINSVLTMHLAFRIVIQCQKLVREKFFDLKENSGKSQWKVREFHLENLVRTLWNSVSILMQICWIQRWCSFSSTLDWTYSFWAYLVQKAKTLCWKSNFIPRIIWICQIWWKCSFAVLWLVFWRLLDTINNSSFHQVSVSLVLSWVN